VMWRSSMRTSAGRRGVPVPSAMSAPVSSSVMGVPFWELGLIGKFRRLGVVLSMLWERGALCTVS
jgi:hypothetical protein